MSSTASYFFSAVAALSLANAANAQSSWYAGASLGATFNSGNYSSQVVAAGEPIEGFRFVSADRKNGSEAGGRLALGYRFNPMFALELGYANFGKQNVNYQFEKTTGLIPPERFFTTRGQFKLDGITLDLVSSAPVGANFSVNGRVGLMSTNLRYSEVATFLNQGDRAFSTSDRQTRFHWGLGGAYQVSKPLAVTLDYTQVQSVGTRFAWNEKGNGRLSYGLLSAGIRYNF